MMKDVCLDPPLFYCWFVVGICNKHSSPIYINELACFHLFWMTLRFAIQFVYLSLSLLGSIWIWMFEFEFVFVWILHMFKSLYKVYLNMFPWYVSVYFCLSLFGVYLFEFAWVYFCLSLFEFLFVKVYLKFYYNFI
jgi:hypothetical protein